MIFIIIRNQYLSFYFKTGIDIPMVKSGIVCTFLMKNHVFDQLIGLKKLISLEEAGKL